MELTPSQKGAVAEMALVHHATRLGIGVSRPLVEGERYDLILDMRPRLVRLQCKWATRRGDVIDVHLRTHRWTPAGSISTTYSASEIDAVGVYCEELDRCYLVPITLVAGRRGLYLRLAPSRNNQQTGINWASSYELGAIAQLGERSAGSRKGAGSSPASSTPEEPRVARLFA
jgi:PD-(D/E)XK endonuclease